MMCADQEYGWWRFLSRIASTSDRLPLLSLCQVLNEMIMIDTRQFVVVVCSIAVSRFFQTNNYSHTHTCVTYYVNTNNYNTLL